MAFQEHSFLAHVTMAGVVLPAVPVGHTRHVISIQVGNYHASDAAILTVEVDRAAETYQIAPRLEVAAGDARAALVGPQTLEEGDTLRLLASADLHLDVIVSYHDNPVAP